MTTAWFVQSLCTFPSFKIEEFFNFKILKVLNAGNLLVEKLVNLLRA